jgi:hypothetical protein
VRGFQNGRDPERTERQLRAARAVSDARREGRIFEGFCLDPPYGFRIEEALRLYGGEQAVEQNCRGCPANALARFDAASLAGCYGLVPLPDDPRPVHEAVERAIAEAVSEADFGQLFPRTSPPWYGLWIESPLSSTRAAALARILTGAIGGGSTIATFGELIAALEFAAETPRPLHVRLYPPGRVLGPWWRLVPHCPRCAGGWSEAAVRKCTICGYAGSPAPDKKRHARGRRPYFPLARLLGEQAATKLLERFERR